MHFSVQDDDAGSVTLSTGRGPVFTYRTGADLWKPYLHPLYTPSGALLTADAPAHAPGHRGVFFGWADVNGIDFWHEGRAADLPQGRITTEGGRVQVEEEKEKTHLHALHLWKKPNGYVLLEEHRMLTAHASDEEGWQVIDWKSEFHAPLEDVALGNLQKSMGLSYCASEAMSGGSFVNSRLQEGNRTDGRPAEWCDYSGPDRSGPRSGGLTIMAARKNPTPRPEFHTSHEPLGFMSASFAYREPFGIRRGQSVTLLYRLVVHDGPADPMLLQTYYSAFVWG